MTHETIPSAPGFMDDELFDLITELETTYPTE